MTERDARRVAELAARSSYGRLLAFLVARSRDVAAAEDALGEAFQAALRVWPERGVPDNPEAWLLTAARRVMIGVSRHQAVRTAGMPTLSMLAEEAEAAMADASFPDDRLRLMFVCAHPAIDPAARAPLMLQTVLGLDAARIASAFLSAPATLSQRLVRAKARIRDAGIGFVLPGPEDLPARVTDVLDAIYAAYGSGWDDVSGADPRRRDLTEEAIWLGRLTATLLPDEPEALGLLALMLHCEARRAARRDTTGAYVPFDAQDTGLWSRHMIAEAERSLARAGAMGRPARYQLEAAIQSAHAQRRMIGSPGWEVTAMLYDALVRIAPSAGSLVGRAAALAEAEGPESGLAALDPLADDLALYQAYWALRAHLLRRLDHGPEAEAAASRAVALSEDPAVRAWLLAQSGSA